MLIFFLSVLYQTTIVSVTVNCDRVCFILYILHVTHFVRILFQIFTKFGHTEEEIVSFRI